MKYSHWHYFLTLDADLDVTSRYVEICKDNFKTYSIEYVRILLAAGSEIDVVAKLVCEKIDSSKKAENINHYREIITAKYSHFHEMEVLLPRYAIRLTPWKAWKGTDNPEWWKSYNDVKHKRHLDFRKANLENVLNCVAGLFVIVMYLYYDSLHELLKLQPPRLLSLPQGYKQGWEWATTYHLPDFTGAKRCTP